MEPQSPLRLIESRYVLQPDSRHEPRASARRLSAFVRPGSLSWKRADACVDVQVLSAPACVYWALGLTARSTGFAGRGGEDTVCHPC